MAGMQNKNSIAFPGKIASFGSPNLIDARKTMKTAGAKRIAERYVKALFDLTESASSTEKVEADLAALAASLAENEEFRQFLSNPLLTRDAQGKAMAALLKKMKANTLTQQFVATLAAQKRLIILPEIAALFSQWAAASRGEISAELISASALKPKEIEQVAASLSKTYGKKVNLDVREDTTLLGGVIVKVGSQQLDASLAGKINRLKIALKAA
jgi:F-type H+-transporting ATPase subunit delta